MINSVLDSSHVSELLDLLNVIIWLTEGPALRIKHIGKQTITALGYSSHEWNQDPNFWLNHLHPEEKTSMLELFRSVKMDGKNRNCIHRFLNYHGEYLWFSTSLRGIAKIKKNKAQIHTEEYELLGMMVNSTERMKTIGFLTENEPLLQNLIEQLPAVIWTTNRELQFTSSSGAGLAKLGLQPNMLVGQSLFEYLRTDNPNHEVIINLKKSLEEDILCKWEYNWLGRDFQFYTKPFRDVNHTVIGVLNISLDVTDQKQAEKERDRLFILEREARTATEIALLQAKEALKIRDEFLSMTSHELRTPLTTIQLVIEYLQSRAANEIPLPLTHLLKTAETEVNRLSRFVSDLLDTSKIRNGKLEINRDKIDLTFITNEIVQRFRHSIKQSETTTLIFNITEPVIGYWDGFRIDQVITNLISNAIKFGAGKPIKIHISIHEQTAVLKVTDHGIGVSKENFKKIFKQYQRGVSSKQYSGLGLGLFIAQSIVNAHEGKIHVESQPNVETTFTVELPLNHK